MRRLGWATAAAFAGNTAWEVVVPRGHLRAGQAIVSVVGASVGCGLRQH